MLTELVKLIKILDLHKMSKKSIDGLKWKMIKEVFKRRKNDSKFAKEKCRMLALEILGLVLFLNPTRIISLEVATTFIEYENNKINLIAIILAETILTLNHCKKIGKGPMRCFEQLLYIWLINHIESKKPVFNNF